MRLRLLGFFCLAASLATASGAFAQTYANVTTGTVGTTGTATGTLGSDGLSYSGDVYGVQTTNGTDIGFQGFAVAGQNPWLPTSTYTSATVATAPTETIIAINANGTDTVNFVGTPVSNLIMDVFSLGQSNPAIITSYTFNQDFEVLSCGPNAYFNGSCFQQGVGYIGDTLTGAEGNGVIEFLGDVSTLTFTVSNAEQFSGFDFGISTAPAPTPEPSSLILLGSGLLTGAGIMRRRLLRK